MLSRSEARRRSRWLSAGGFAVGLPAFATLLMSVLKLAYSATAGTIFERAVGAPIAWLYREVIVGSGLVEAWFRNAPLPDVRDLRSPEHVKLAVCCALLLLAIGMRQRGAAWARMQRRADYEGQLEHWKKHPDD